MDLRSSGTSPDCAVKQLAGKEDEKTLSPMHVGA